MVPLKKTSPIPVGALREGCTEAHELLEGDRWVDHQGDFTWRGKHRIPIRSES